MASQDVWMQAWLRMWPARATSAYALCSLPNFHRAFHGLFVATVIFPTPLTLCPHGVPCQRWRHRIRWRGGKVCVVYWGFRLPMLSKLAKCRHGLLCDVRHVAKLEFCDVVHGKWHIEGIEGKGVARGC